MKKVLIWIGCILSLSIFVNALKYGAGISLGGIPTALLYGGMFWLARTLCKKLDIKTVEKEAHSKGMSVRQYVASIVPPSLMTFCEAHKGEPSVLKENFKKFVEEEPIPKRFLVVLLEMYK